MANGWLVFGALLAVYLLVLVVLVKTRMLERLNMSLFLGVLLMVKTTRGKRLLNWFARAPGFFDRSAHFGLYLTGVAMVAMTALLVFQLFLLHRIRPEQAPSPSLILGIPGINPVIPVGFGIIALVFAVVVHEFSHGIMARVYGMKVKTMGILLFIVPVGAFVEPDEDELQAAPRIKRAKVFSAGPLSNLVFAVLFGFLFSASMAAGSAPVNGVPLQAIEAGSPANESGLLPGWIITHVDGIATPCLGDFQALMGNTTTPIRPNTTITLTVLKEPGGPSSQVDLTTARRGDLFNDTEAQEFYAANPDRANDTVIGFIPYNACTIHEYLADPFGSLPAFLTYVSLPFFALGGQFPLTEPFNDFFATPDFLPANVFWIAMNLFYWLFWIDLMLGLTNVLPLVPLDGGHMFRDFLDAVFARLRPGWESATRAKAVNRGAGVMALFILLLIVAQFVGPALIASVRG